MKKMLTKLIAAGLSLSLLCCAAGCDKNTGADDSSAVAVSATKDEPSHEPAEEPDIGEHNDYAGQTAKYYESGTIIVADQDGTKRGMEEFTMNLGDGCLEFYASEINTVKEMSGPKVNVYSMLVPTACELYCPANALSLVEDQSSVINDVRDMLVNVKHIDVLPTLQNHNAENIYFRTDSRWAPLGAYYAARVFAREAGVPFDDISEYRAAAEKEYHGDLLNLCGPQGYEDLGKVSDKFVYYEPKNAFTTNYYDDEFNFLTTDKFFEPVEESMYESYYRGGYYCLRLDTKVKNDRKVLIVKDNFGTAFPSFLTGSFSQIYVVSYDYLSANLIEIISDFGITDVLYLFGVDTVTDTTVYTLETIRTQATHGSLEDDAPDATDPDAVSDSDRSSDSDSDSDAMSDDYNDEPEYIYDVGINNQIGIVESSDEDAPAEVYDDYAGEYTEDEYDGGYDGEYGYDEGY